MGSSTVTERGLFGERGLVFCGMFPKGARRGVQSQRFVFFAKNCWLRAAANTIIHFDCSNNKCDHVTRTRARTTGIFFFKPRESTNSSIFFIPHWSTTTTIVVVVVVFFS